METLTTVIVDDSQRDAEHLITTIHNNFPQINILGQLPISFQSLTKIDQLTPDLVFFDSSGQNHSGINVLQNWTACASKNVILTVPKNDNKVEKLDIPVSFVLSKPICISALSEVIQKFKYNDSFHSLKAELQLLRKKVKACLFPLIAIPTMNGLECIDAKEVVYIEAADNYAIFYLSGGEHIVSSQSLRKVEKKLSYLPFIRIHRSFLVNQNHIRKYIKGDGGQVMMSNSIYLNVARNRKDELIFKLTN